MEEKSRGSDSPLVRELGKLFKREKRISYDNPLDSPLLKRIKELKESGETEAIEKFVKKDIGTYDAGELSADLFLEVYPYFIQVEDLVSRGLIGRNVAELKRLLGKEDIRKQFKENEYLNQKVILSSLFPEFDKYTLRLPDKLNLTKQELEKTCLNLEDLMMSFPDLTPTIWDSIHDISHFTMKKKQLDKLFSIVHMVISPEIDEKLKSFLGSERVSARSLQGLEEKVSHLLRYPERGSRVIFDEEESKKIKELVVSGDKTEHRVGTLLSPFLNDKVLDMETFRRYLLVLGKENSQYILPLLKRASKRIIEKGGRKGLGAIISDVNAASQREDVEDTISDLKGHILNTLPEDYFDESLSIPGKLFGEKVLDGEGMVSDAGITLLTRLADLSENQKKYALLAMNVISNGKLLMRGDFEYKSKVLGVLDRISKAGHARDVFDSGLLYDRMYALTDEERNKLLKEFKRPKLPNLHKNVEKEVKEKIHELASMLSGPFGRNEISLFEAKLNEIGELSGTKIGSGFLSLRDNTEKLLGKVSERITIEDHLKGAREGYAHHIDQLGLKTANETVSKVKLDEVVDTLSDLCAHEDRRVRNASFAALAGIMMKKKGLKVIRPFGEEFVKKINTKKADLKKDLDEKDEGGDEELVNTTSKLLSLSEIHDHVQKIVGLARLLTGRDTHISYGTGKKAAQILDLPVDELEPMINSLHEDVEKIAKEEGNTLAKQISEGLKPIADLNLCESIRTLEQDLSGNEAGTRLLNIFRKTPILKLSEKADDIAKLIPKIMVPETPPAELKTEEHAEISLEHFLQGLRRMGFEVSLTGNVEEIGNTLGDMIARKGGMDQIIGHIRGYIRRYEPTQKGNPEFNALKKNLRDLLGIIGERALAGPVPEKGAKKGSKPKERKPKRRERLT